MMAIIADNKSVLVSYPPLLPPPLPFLHPSPLSPPSLSCNI